MDTKLFKRRTLSTDFYRPYVVIVDSGKYIYGKTLENFDKATLDGNSFINVHGRSYDQ